VAALAQVDEVLGVEREVKRATSPSWFRSRTRSRPSRRWRASWHERLRCRVSSSNPQTSTQAVPAPYLRRHCLGGLQCRAAGHVDASNGHGHSPSAQDRRAATGVRSDLRV